MIETSRFTRSGAASALLLLVLLSGCATREPVAEGDADVDNRVRAPARQESAGVQVYSLQNKAVAELMEKAAREEQAGRLDEAADLLERAMRIQPRNPELLQQMAEVQLGRQEYTQALSFSERSWEIGPRVGEICSRNWRTIGVAREKLGNRAGAREAESRASRCMNTKPESF